MRLDPLPRWLAVVAVAAVTGGCSVVQPYLRPLIPEPAFWGEAPPVAAAPAQLPSADWWRGFGTPPLDALMRQALDNNFDLAAAVARVRQANAQLRIAGAALLPTVDAGAGATRLHQPPLATRASGGRATQTNTFEATLSASYEIDFWGKNAAAAQSARAAAQASQFDRHTVALTVQSSVATTYFAVLGLRDRLDVARQNLAIAREVLEAVQDRFAAGLATDLDIAQQESEVAATAAAIAPLEQQLRQNVIALAILFGHLPENLDFAAGTLASVTIPAVDPGLPSDLLARRPDVQFAEAQLKAANADVGAARAAYFPSIQLTGKYGVESLALSTLLTGTSTLFSLAASAAQPIFHGGALDGALELKQARYDELTATYRKAVVAAFSDVETALVAVAKTAEEEQAQLVAVATARRAADIAREQLRGGIIDITTALNVQKTLFQAEDSLVQARNLHVQAVVGLYKALGGGWQVEAATAP